MTGGIPVEGEDDAGTSCCRVTRDDSEYLLTVVHRWDNDENSGCDTDYGQTACRYGTTVGDLWDIGTTKDWAMIELNSDESINNQIDDSSSGDETVYGHYTDGALTTLMTESRPIWKQGVSTGNRQGVIKDTNSSSITTVRTSVVLW